MSSELFLVPIHYFEFFSVRWLIPATFPQLRADSQHFPATQGRFPKFARKSRPIPATPPQSRADSRNLPATQPRFPQFPRNPGPIPAIFPQFRPGIQQFFSNSKQIPATFQQPRAWVPRPPPARFGQGREFEVLGRDVEVLGEFEV